MGWFVYPRNDGEGPGCQVALAEEAPFMWQLQGTLFREFTSYWCPGARPSGTPPGSQAIVKEIRNWPKKADKLPVPE